ncbi:DUF4381 domain-containing protein [Neomegalonema sp.]|uniref:DUF4381 domain-containing protein n=1 Tax=Neomegalonema sp. TaxID=2039713 RepID=UPI0026063AD3|nr:DUF4381 domain-containing protein [Neomegalonema sp.]MDD2867354.1 DUF4381 domain-containing protein [Neomegalonema sp.]
METEELLERMRDLALPPIPTAAPVPWGFLILAALALAALGALLALRLRSRDWRREARAQFAALAAQPGGRPEALTEAARLLRRVALKSAGPEAARLTGEPWLQRLDEIFGADFFTSGAGRVFGAELYAADPPPAGPILEGLAALARRRIA